MVVLNLRKAAEEAELLRRKKHEIATHIIEQCFNQFLAETRVIKKKKKKKKAVKGNR